MFEVEQKSEGPTEKCQAIKNKREGINVVRIVIIGSKNEGTDESQESIFQKKDREKVHKDSVGNMKAKEHQDIRQRVCFKTAKREA